jgi:hypothetical protein
MKKLSILLLLFACVFVFTENAMTQSDIQCRINILNPGSSKLNDIKMLFGTANTKIKRSSWIDDSSTASDSKKTYRFVDDEKDLSNVIGLYSFDYKEKGLLFSIFSDTAELY